MNVKRFLIAILLLGHTVCGADILIDKNKIGIARSGGALTVTIPLTNGDDSQQVGDMTVSLLSSAYEPLARVKKKVILLNGQRTETVALPVTDSTPDIEQCLVRIDYQGHIWLKRFTKTQAGQEIHVIGQKEWLAGSSASLRVIVTRSQGGEPIENANILISTTPQSGGKAYIHAETKSDEQGTASLQFKIPGSLVGQRTVTVRVKSEFGEDTIESPVEIKSGVKIFLIADKPVYQPGQLMHIRALAAHESTDEPIAGRETILEVYDGKGNKVFKENAATSEFGIVSADFQLADEVNQGDYAIKAILDNDTAEKTVQVYEYVLPKFKVTVNNEKKFYAPGDTVKGNVDAHYFFGKAVAGAKVKVIANCFDAGFNEFATVEGQTNDEGRYDYEFTIPDKLVGQPSFKGNTIIQMDVRVLDTADHEEQKFHTFHVATDPLQVEVIPESGKLVPNVENEVYLVASYPDGSVAQPTLNIDSKFLSSRREIKCDENGIATIALTPFDATSSVPVFSNVHNVQSQYAPRPQTPVLLIDAELDGDHVQIIKDGLALDASENALLLRLDKGVYTMSQTMRITALSPAYRSETVFLDAVKNGQTVLTKTMQLKDGRAELELPLDNQLTGTLALTAYIIRPDGNMIRDTRQAIVTRSDDLNIEIVPGKQQYEPGEPARLRIAVTGNDGQPIRAALGLHVVDESVYSLTEKEPGLAKVFFAIEKELLESKVEIHGYHLDKVVRLSTQKYEDNAKLSKALLAKLDAHTDFAININTAVKRIQRAQSDLFAIRNVTANKTIPFGKEPRDVEELLLSDGEQPTDLPKLDPWGQPYQVLFADENVFLNSRGRDMKLSTDDDIRIPNYARRFFVLSASDSIGNVQSVKKLSESGASGIQDTKNKDWNYFFKNDSYAIPQQQAYANDLSLGDNSKSNSHFRYYYGYRGDQSAPQQPQSQASPINWQELNQSQLQTWYRIDQRSRGRLGGDALNRGVAVDLADKEGRMRVQFRDIGNKEGLLREPSPLNPAVNAEIRAGHTVIMDEFNALDADGDGRAGEQAGILNGRGPADGFVGQDMAGNAGGGGMGMGGMGMMGGMGGPGAVRAKGASAEDDLVLMPDAAMPPIDAYGAVHPEAIIVGQSSSGRTSAGEVSHRALSEPQSVKPQTWDFQFVIPTIVDDAGDRDYSVVYDKEIKRTLSDLDLGGYMDTRYTYDETSDFAKSISKEALSSLGYTGKEKDAPKTPLVIGEALDENQLKQAMEDKLPSLKTTELAFTKEEELLQGDKEEIAALGIEKKQPQAEKRKAVRVRRFFPETLFYTPELITDDRGQIALDLPGADSITTWRMSAMANAKSGAIGDATSALKVFKPFFVDLDLPVALIQNDEVTIPVAVYNYLPVEQTVDVNLEPAAWYDLLEGTHERNVSVAANEVTSVTYRIRARQLGQNPITVFAWGSEDNDAIGRGIEVRPNGDARFVNQNGRLSGSVQETVTFPEGRVEGADRLFVKIYPGVFSQVVEGLDAILRMPNGCFEQTSSTTYPNILALDYMKRSGSVTPAIEMKAREYINLGYQRLLTFEIDGGGFQVFGNPPATRILSAYGLMEFMDMSQVYTVDPNVIERTKVWLLSQMKEDGSWEPDQNYSHAEMWKSIQNNNLLSTAYVTMALAKAGAAPQMGKTKQYLVAHTADARDAYTLAILCNALVALDPSNSATKECVTRLVDMASVEGDFMFWESDASMSFARGNHASVEATAWAALALIEDGRYASELGKALNWLIEQKDPNGTWGTTHGTVLALKAMIESLGKRTEQADATILVHVNGQDAATLKVSPDNSDVFRQIDVTKYVQEGANQVSIDLEGEGSLLYQVTGKYFMPWPDGKRTASTGVSDDSQFSIDVKYDRSELRRNDTVTCNVTAINKRNQRAEMVMIDVGVPPGFRVERSAMDDLLEKETIAKYTIMPRQLLIYLESMDGGQAIEMAIPMKATLPMTAKAPESTIYEYYNPQNKNIAPPMNLRVN